MLHPGAPLSYLQTFFDTRFAEHGKDWVKWEPETILLSLQDDHGPNEPVDPILREKVLVLQVLNENINNFLALPEFLIWATSVINNQPADFEHILLPTSLELAWTITELKRIASLTDQKWEPGFELKSVVGYILKEEGYSIAPPVFDFVSPDTLHPGQTPEDIEKKRIACIGYVRHMDDAWKNSEH